MIIVDPHKFAAPSTPQTTGDPTANVSGFGGYTWITTGLTISNNNNIQKIGFYSGTVGIFSIKVARFDSSGNYTIMASESVSHAGGGWQDFILASPYVIPGAGTFHIGVYVPSTQVMGYLSGAVSRAYKLGDLGLGAQTGLTEQGVAGLALRVNQGL